MLDKTFYISPKTIQKLLAVTPDVLVKENFLNQADGAKSFICPDCGSGTLSAKFISGAWLYRCQSCNEFFNNFSFFERFFGSCYSAKDYLNLYEKLCSIFKIPFKSETSSKPSINNLRLFDIQCARAELFNASPSYFQKLSFETVSFFNCGFLGNWTPPADRRAGKTGNGGARLIFPSGNSYAALIPRAIRKDDANNIFKSCEGNYYYFNFDSISPDSVNIITDDELDAMTIWQVTDGKYPVVAVFTSSILLTNC